LNNNKQSKLKCSKEQAQSVLRLSAMPEWDQVQYLIQCRFDDAQRRLESADEKNFRFEQGRVQELRFLLELQTSAKALLDQLRAPKRTPSID
jgi:hypothetical protein